MEDINYLVACTTILIGTFLGTLGSQLVSKNSKTRWIYSFYIMGVAGIIYGSIYYHNIYYYKVPLNTDEIYASFACIASGILLIIYTLTTKQTALQYTLKDLNPIVNNFTNNADHQEIKLFGGDLNFFGNIILMDDNIQYKALKEKNFNKVSILCEEPQNDQTRIRYGKLLSELNGIQIKFYNPDTADLKIRGRIKTIEGVTRVLMYSKTDVRDLYEALETDIANRNGVLINNIWNLVWSLARPIPELEFQQLINQYHDQTAIHSNKVVL